jgi:hypothetical protein
MMRALRPREEKWAMFDTLSDRLGGVFDKLKGRGVFAGKAGTAFPVRKRAQQGRAASVGGELQYV